jgi:hypothetical protein
MAGIILNAYRMTAISCVLLWLAFVAAVCLLVVAGIGMGWVLSRRIAQRLRKPEDPDGV